ncbi:MAG: right-handed parallel beta-helix repeat-containing protein [Blastocatellia bacterium]
MAVGVGAASDPTFTAIDSPEATYTAPSRIGRNVFTEEDDFSAQANVLKVPRDFATIQAAVNAASTGDTIKVAAGNYNENVVISTSGLRLRSSEGAVIDGAGLTGSGIQILGTAAQPVADVEVSGFEVRDFQRGIVVQFAARARIIGNDVHDNNKWPGAVGALDQAVGIDLVTAQSSDVSQNSVHNNGAGGIQLRVGSTENVLRENRIFENGALLTADMGGRGVLVTGAFTNDNEMRSNKILRNFGRGISIARPAGTVPITGNLVLKNRVQETSAAAYASWGLRRITSSSRTTRSTITSQDWRLV